SAFARLPQHPFLVSDLERHPADANILTDSVGGSPDDDAGAIQVSDLDPEHLRAGVRDDLAVYAERRAYRERLGTDIAAGPAGGGDRGDEGSGAVAYCIEGFRRGRALRRHAEGDDQGIGPDLDGPEPGDDHPRNRGGP